MCGLAGGLMAVSSVLQGNAQASAYSQQASIANQNAALANQAANNVQVEKQSQEAQIQEQKRQTIGTARASLAANGSDSGYGTGLGAIQDISYGAQKDMNNLEYNAAVQQGNLMQQSQNYKNQASYYNAASSNAKLGGWLGAAAGYASGLSSYSGSNALEGANTSYMPSTYNKKNFWQNSNNYTWQKWT